MRIRAALGRSVNGAPPEQLPTFLNQIPSANDPRSLMTQFEEELQGVGGHVAEVSSLEEIKRCLEDLMRDRDTARVAVSDGEIIQELGIGEWLESGEVRVMTGSEQPYSSEQFKQELLECTVGLTSADYALADTGTLVLVSGNEHHRLISLLPPVHVCILRSDRILPGLTQLLARVNQESYARERPPQSLICITGPSRTADIEQTITTGVHGPKSLHVLIYSPRAT